MARPTNLPGFATNATYPAGVNPWSSQPPRVQPSAGLLAQGFTPQTDLPAEYVNYLIGLLGDWVNYLDVFRLASCDGSDGNATLDGTATVAWATKIGSVYTMTRDTALNNLTVTGAGVILQTANFRLIGNGVLTTAAGGSVRNTGGAGAAGSGSTGGVGGTPVPVGSLGIGTAGGNGNQNASGAAGTAISIAIGGTGGTGGAGGSAGGNGGTVTPPAANLGSYRLLFEPMLGYVLSYASTGVWTQLQGGSGGGAGGSNGVPSASGGGGAGAGIMVIVFRSIQLANASDILCIGGAGGAGSSGAGTNGGGAGGAGGGIFIAYGIINQTLSAAVNAPGGAGGAGSGGGSSGATGGNGAVIAFSLA